MARSLHAERIYFLGQLLGCELFSLNFQCNQISVIPDIFEKTLCFFIFDIRLYGFTRVVRCLFIRHLDNFQLCIAAEALGILGNRIP